MIVLKFNFKEKLMINFENLFVIVIAIVIIRMVILHVVGFYYIVFSFYY